MRQSEARCKSDARLQSLAPVRDLLGDRADLQLVTDLVYRLVDPRIEFAS
jgi:hypothetical protein